LLDQAWASFSARGERRVVNAPCLSRGVDKVRRSFGAIIAASMLAVTVACLTGAAAVSAPMTSRAISNAQDLQAEVGQMIIIGFQGDSVEDAGFKDALRQLEKGIIGGVLFLDHNIRSPVDLKRMTMAVKACACKFPPLIAIDEEGGRVQRLGKLGRDTYTPSAVRVASTADATKAALTYRQLASRVASFGFNLNFGPVVDVNINPDNPVIGRLGRSFSPDPNVVVAFAEAFIGAHREVGVLTALKHFPGHGSSHRDSHLGAVDVTGIWVRDAELLPYRVLIGRGKGDLVMVGHLLNRAWGGVASIGDSTAISNLLRGELGFQGVVITDDLEMAAVRSNTPDFSTAFSMAVQAGNDILVVSNRVSNRQRLGDWINETIMSAVGTGHLSASRIRRSFERITRLKEQIPKGASCGMDWPVASSTSQQTSDPRRKC
jgi:beta-N-acetylhexosaminidase